jgi:NAD(P)-dependent dehydrogenase (short-subunit alcohol dehydrogenase family)
MNYIITGASRGIGRYLFDTLTGKGHKVIGTCNSTIVETEGFYRLDITNYQQIQVLISQLKEQLKNIVLINCAGINYNSFAHKADIKEWTKVIDVNLTGTFHVIHAVLPIMRSQNYGRIINISSVVANYPTPGVSAYAASKAALTGLTKSLSVENALKGITVNVINLGYVDIGMGINDVPEKYRKTIEEKIPCRRFCEPADILKTVEYIVDTPYLNGAEINLNGGIL